jgi:hypothetical protein
MVDHAQLVGFHAGFLASAALLLLAGALACLISDRGVREAMHARAVALTSVAAAPERAGDALG